MLQAFDIYRSYVSEEACLPSSGSEYKSLNIFESIEAFSDAVFDIIKSIYHDHPLILIEATFWKKLVSHH